MQSVGGLHLHIRALRIPEEARGLLTAENAGRGASGDSNGSRYEIDAEDIPLTFRYLGIEAADSVSVEAIRIADLGYAWQTRVDRTRRAGDEWLRSRRTAILRIPSVIAPGTWNFLINPAHRDHADIRIARVHSYVVDQRLLRQAHANAGSKTSMEPMRRREPHR